MAKTIIKHLIYGTGSLPEALIPRRFEVKNERRSLKIYIYYIFCMWSVHNYNYLSMRQSRPHIDYN